MLLTPEEKERLAAHNMRLIKSVASQYFNSNSWLTFDDLFDVAQEGFVKALNSYDTEHATKFSTYAVTCMKNEVCGYLRLNRVKGLKLEYSYDGAMKDSSGEYKENLSLENVLTQDEIDGVDNKILLKEDMRIVMEEVEKLSPLEKIVILERFGFKDGVPKTQQEVAKLYNMSQANVSRLQNTALEALFLKLKDKIIIENDAYYDNNSL